MSETRVYELILNDGTRYEIECKQEDIDKLLTLLVTEYQNCEEL